MTDIPPILLSTIICDRVIFDKISGMPSVINIIQNVNSPKYPVQYPAIVFFCEMTNGHGFTETEIRLVDAQQDDKIIFKQQGRVEFKDVRQILTLVLNLHGIVFPAPGEYRFQLFANEQLLGERRVLCRKVRPRQKGDAG